MRRTAHELKVINGAERTPKRPKKSAVAGTVPQAETLKPPDFLDAIAKREFRRVAALMAASGSLCALDLALLSTYAVAFSRWKQAESELRNLSLTVRSKTNVEFQRPLIGIANSAARVMNAAAKELGLTPTARRTLGIVPSEPSDAADRYF
ncbi:phage terminase small subunit P27 family [Paraburkholderia sp. J11-2]|uniref:phage terminase small subunit P27 family n=1 Tax=Paraburkholderia sp. J11-2 TaxID=2805431 RepID=UPI002AB7E5AA|nr:phage terminase small subunit P27 family [Paraburkholderia sp. J11-2]